VLGTAMLWISKSADFSMVDLILLKSHAIKFDANQKNRDHVASILDC
jgi:hypothetical protein